MLKKYFGENWTLNPLFPENAYTLGGMKKITITNTYYKFIPQHIVIVKKFFEKICYKLWFTLTVRIRLE